jgi:hypothetical protein
MTILNYVSLNSVSKLTVSKLTDRSTLFAALVLTFLTADATLGEVIYTDIPDVVVSQSKGNVLQVDLDGDATDDVKFEHQFFNPSDIKSAIVGLGGTKLGTHETNPPVAGLHAYLAGETLDHSPFSLRTSIYWDSSVGGMNSFGYAMTTQASGTNSLAPSNVPGGWNTPGHQFFTTTSQGDRYVGVRLDIAGEGHVGWVRMRVNGGAGSGNDVGQMTVYDFAYESEPGVGITIGDIGVPEPGTLALCLIGAFGLLAASRGRNRLR